MQLFLLRHGPAWNKGEHEGCDASRGLTVAGGKEVREVAKAMKRLGIKPTVILSSPYVRAMETAEIVRQGLGLKKEYLLETDFLRPGSEHSDLVRELRAYSSEEKEVLLVGHEPDLSEFASLLISGSRKAVLSFKKSGLAKLECDKLRAGRCGRLLWLQTPRLIRG